MSDADDRAPWRKLDGMQVAAIVLASIASFTFLMSSWRLNVTIELDDPALKKEIVGALKETAGKLNPALDISDHMYRGGS
jgi:hypothetical protein